MKNCVFCKIARHKSTAHILYEDNFVMAFLDSDPISDGHALIIPKEHFQDLHSLDEKIGGRIMEISKKMADALKKAFGYDGIMLMQTNGIFQDVPHFHMHVFGRNKKKDIRIRYPAGINKTGSHLEMNAKKLKNIVRPTRG